MMTTAFLQDALGMILPLQCAGCGEWDTSLCERCWLIADAEPQLSALDDSRGVPEIPVWSLGSYSGRLRRLILSAKHDRGRDLSAFLFQAGCRLGESVSQHVGIADVGPVWVVPAPSSWRRQWDGREITGALARGVAEGIDQVLGEGATEVVAALQLRLRGGSQSRRGKDRRRLGRQDSMRMLEPVPSRTAVILVDDVCTTGATLLEMVRLLGGGVQAAAVLSRV